MANLTTWQATIQDDDTGAAVVSPVVTVRLGGPSGDLADLFDINGDPIANPVTGGTDGFVQFQFRPSRYWVQAADGGTFSSAWYVDADGDLNWETRADLVSDIAAGMNLPNGTVVSDGAVQYVASAGATAISDMPGWLPFGDVYPDHFATNAMPGITDMAAAINAADTYCVANGVVLYWRNADHYADPATQITPSARWAGRARIVIGAKGAANNSPAILCAAAFKFDEIEVTFGANHERGIKFQGGTNGGRVIASNSSFNSSNDSVDACVQISGAGNIITDLFVDGHSRLVNNDGTETEVQSFTGSNYVQGWLNSGSNAFVGSIICTGQAAASTGAPGENGLLHQGGSNCHYGYVRVEDAGEHAVRLGGGASYAGISFGTVVAINPSGNGFKCRPDAGFTAEFYVDKIIAEDCGSGALTIAAQDVGVLVERAANSRIGHIDVRKNARSRSCYSALEVNAIDGLEIGSINASDVAYSFVSVRTEDGDANGLHVGRLTGTNSDDVAVSLVFPGTGNAIRDIEVSGAVSGVANESIRAVRQIDSTYTAANYLRSGVDPGGAGTVSQTCRFDLIAPGSDDIGGNGDILRNIVYRVRERSGSAVNGPGRLVDLDNGKLVYYINNLANDAATSVVLPPRSMKGTIVVTEDITTAGAYGVAVGTISTASSKMSEHVASNASATTTDGTLTGTTGTDGTLNYRLNGNTLYVENRRGTLVDAVVTVNIMQAQ